MEILISEACRRSLDSLRGEDYDLVGPEGEIILPRTWETTLQPGWTISMVFTEAGQQAIINHSHARQSDVLQRLEVLQARQEASHAMWEAERRNENPREQNERRLRERLEDDRRILEQQLAEMHNLLRIRRRPNPKHRCSISPCLCWLSGNTRKCHSR